MDLEALPAELAVARLAPDAALPDWAEGEFLAVVRTGEELSIACAAGRVPGSVRSSGPWRALRVAGTLDHSLTGVLAAIAGPLATAEIPIFAISSFDTDFVLVPSALFDDAAGVLERSGHRLSSR